MLLPKRWGKERSEAPDARGPIARRFAEASEWSYTFFARRRDLLSRATRLLWGPALEPERNTLVSWLFLRLFGAIYVAAFASLGVQVLGLVGPDGILPLGEYLSAARQGWGAAAYWRLPTLFWLGSSDTVLLAATMIGVVLGLLVTLGIWVRPALIGAFVLYLSFVYAGQVFMNFQWDLLLLEAGFLAIFLTAGSHIIVWLYRWLVFRFLFLAGAMKLLSGDPTWRNLTALDYHFWTQPLPTPLAWYAAQLPHWVLASATAVVLAIELGLVFLILLPRRLRTIAAWGVLLFQLLILLTGNYNFFNLQTMLLCIFLFDDAALRRLVPSRLASWIEVPRAAPGRRGNSRRGGAGADRRAGRPQPHLAAVDTHRLVSGGQANGGDFASAHRQPLWAIRHHDDHAAGDYHRRFGRRPNLARVRVPLQAGASNPAPDVEHPASAAAGLANVVCCLPQRRGEPLVRAPNAGVA